MSLKDFLKSKVFFKQVAIAVVIVIVIIVGLLNFLNVITNHGEEIPVPDLRKSSVEKTQERLDELGLEGIVLDTVDFNPDFPPYTVTEQDPLPKVNVKNGRKVYVKVNAGNYSTVPMPDLIQKSYRQAVPMLNNAGLQEGTKTYVPYLAKDVVLEMKQKGKPLKKGDKVMKASKIDLVLGDGKQGYEEPENTSTDSTNTTEED